MHQIDKKTHSHRLISALLALTGALAACKEPPAEPAAETSDEAPSTVESTCGNAGLLIASLSGAIDVRLDLRDHDLRCESMPRPDSAGVRLRFSSEVEGERLAIIIALPTLEAGLTGDGFDSNVTITVENSGRFFSTPNLDTCWSDIATNEQLPPRAGAFLVAGSLSCVGPLGEINGDAFVDVQNLRFSGIADWSAQ